MRKTRRSKQDRKRVLSDHTQIGKTFVPPLIAGLGDMRHVRWLRDLVPELLWVSLLIDRLPLKRAVEVASALVVGAVSVGADVKLSVHRNGNVARVGKGATAAESISMW